jgi:hypothetical protein
MVKAILYTIVLKRLYQLDPVQTDRLMSIHGAYAVACHAGWFDHHRFRRFQRKLDPFLWTDAI